MKGLLNRLIVTTLPLVPKFIVRRVASRYVAGDRLEDAVATVRRLEGEGAMATLDLLGEEIHERGKAEAAVEQYLRMLDTIHRENLRCNVSIKPTQMGLKIDEAFCLANVERLVEKAASLGNFVRIDMEDRTTTDATLRIYRQLHARFAPAQEPAGDGYTAVRYGHVGTVFQAYMRRTLSDVAGLPAVGANIRLCKGIYIEPRETAWKDYETVRLSFLAALEKLLTQGVYVGIATHDEHLVCGAVALVDRLRVPRERYEFQMLLGVEPQLRRILIAGGHRLRVYVPYGEEWYQYSTRRLRENPEVAGHVLRAMFSGK